MKSNQRRMHKEKSRSDVPWFGKQNIQPSD